MLKKDWGLENQSFFNANRKKRLFNLPNLLLFIAGSIMTLGYSPFDIWLLPFLSLSLLVHAITTANTSKQAFDYGFVFGLGWFGFGLSWIHIAIADFGGIPLIFSLILMLLLVSYLAIFPALFAWTAFKLIPKIGLFVIVPMWLLVEVGRSYLFTGFPWLSIGYSQLNSALSGFIPIVGEFGLQALMMSIIYCFLSVTGRKSALVNRIHPTIIATIVITGYMLTSLQWFTPNGKKLNLALVQGNVVQSVKWQPENELPTMLKYYELSADYWNKADLIIWPESAVPRIEVMSEDYLTELDKLAFESNTALITGIVDYQPHTTAAFNNIIVLGKQYSQDSTSNYQYGHTNRYNKHHLLPFGEFVPFESILRTLAPIFDLPFSSFSRGYYLQDNLIANNFNITSAICFEIAFPKQIRDNLTDNSDFILTISNDAWFGDSHGPWQHLQIARMRAIEFSMPIVRVTNNGVTAVIDAQGDIVKVLPQNTAQVLNYELPLSDSHSFYKQHGNTPTTLFVIFLTLLFYLVKPNRFKF